MHRYNRSFDAEAQRHCAASTAQDPAAPGAMPLRVAQLQSADLPTSASARDGARRNSQADQAAAVSRDVEAVGAGPLAAEAITPAFPTTDSSCVSHCHAAVSRFGTQT